MQGVRKLFDPTLNDAHDPESKRQAALLLQQLYGPNWIVDTYDESAEKFRDGCYDLIAHRGEIVHRFNAKRKMEWGKERGDYNEYHGWPFKFRDLNIEERSKHDNIDFVIMFNRQFDRSVIISKKIILSSPLQEKPNKFVRRGELFYCVDLKTSPILFLQLEDGHWLKTKRNVAPKSYVPNHRFSMFDSMSRN